MTGQPLRCDECGITLVYLPPYSPDLNPLEYIWKSIKRVIFRTFIVDINHMKKLILENFLDYSSRLSFARGWIERFLEEKIKYGILGS